MRRTTHPSVLPLVMLRLERNVTQAEMADRLGVTQGAITNWETGVTPMTLMKAQAYADVLGCEIKLVTTMKSSTPGRDDIPDFNLND
jgi:transcriptional regulator with XRE-family HTH domain